MEVKLENSSIWMSSTKARNRGRQVRIPSLDSLRFECLSVCTCGNGKRRSIDRRHREEKEVPSTALVELFDQACIFGPYVCEDLGAVGCAVCVSYVVDADELWVC